MRIGALVANKGIFVLALAVVLAAFGTHGPFGRGGADAQDIAAADMAYVVLAWNDLGMHCLNPTYDAAVILPPYNTPWAQVIRRGDPPRIVTEGIRVEYSIRNNTYSAGKRSYGQFWEFSKKLFGVDLPVNTGLNLVDPARHNGLSGAMVARAGHFEANGIPLTPVDDAMAWNPFQVADVVVKDAATGKELARTSATLPTSDEIDCAKCHGPNALVDVLERHDKGNGTKLAADRPVLCAGCHGSPALGRSDPGKAGKFLSQAIHGFHAGRGAACYDCHPGPKTQCTRSLAHTAPDGNCVACHGDLKQVSGSIASAGRVPWVVEPKCSSCHQGVAGVDTGNDLYRSSLGHHGVSCPACHGAPHAMVPSRVASDNAQAIQYQGVAKAIGSCGVCHPNSHGGGLPDFLAAHGPDGLPTACSVCHTAMTTNDPSAMPHRFQWKAR